jgi:hypothetical protein
MTTRARYAAASLAFFQAMERVAKSKSHIVLAYAAGTDPLPYVRQLFDHWLNARSQVTAPLVFADREQPLPDQITSAHGGLFVMQAPFAVDEHARLALNALEPNAACQLLLLQPSSKPLKHIPTELASLSPEVLWIPRLSERAEDLESLALDSVGRLSFALFGEVYGIAPAALNALVNHAWPGDEAEFRGVIAIAVQSARKNRVELENLPPYLRTT